MKIETIIKKYEGKLAHYTNEQSKVNERRKKDRSFLGLMDFENELCLCRTILKDLRKIKKKYASPAINK